MDLSDPEWNRRQAAQQRELADVERRSSEELRRAGRHDQADRHLINAVLHELRAGAFEAAARAGARQDDLGG